MSAIVHGLTLKATIQHIFRSVRTACFMCFIFCRIEQNMNIVMPSDCWK